MDLETRFKTVLTRLQYSEADYKVCEEKKQQLDQQKVLKEKSIKSIRKETEGLKKEVTHFFLCSVKKKIFFHPTYFFLKFFKSFIFFHFLIFHLILSYLLYFILFFSSLYDLLFLFNVVEGAGRSFERTGAAHQRGEKISLLIFFSCGYFQLLVLTFRLFF